MKIKLCGMFRDCDIDYANEAKPDYVGFILGFPKSHRNIDAETARRLRSGLFFANITQFLRYSDLLFAKTRPNFGRVRFQRVRAIFWSSPRAAP